MLDQTLMAIWDARLGKVPADKQVEWFASWMADGVWNFHKSPMAKPFDPFDAYIVDDSDITMVMAGVMEAMSDQEMKQRFRQGCAQAITKFTLNSRVDELPLMTLTEHLAAFQIHEVVPLLHERMEQIISGPSKTIGAIISMAQLLGSDGFGLLKSIGEAEARVVKPAVRFTYVLASAELSFFYDDPAEQEGHVLGVLHRYEPALRATSTAVDSQRQLTRLVVSCLPADVSEGVRAFLATLATGEKPALDEEVLGKCLTPDRPLRSSRPPSLRMASSRPI